MKKRKIIGEKGTIVILIFGIFPVIENFNNS